jgi:ATP-binding cassette subfamily B protein
MSQEPIPTTVGSFFRKSIRPYRGLFILAAVFVIVAEVISQGSSYIFKIIVDAVEADDYRTAFIAGMMYPVLVFIVQTLFRGSGVVVGRIQSGIIRDQNNNLVQHLLSHSKSFFDNRFAGSLVSKVSHVVTGAEQFVSIVIWTFLETSISLLVTAVLIFTVSWQAGCIFLFLVFFILIINISMIRGKKEIAEKTSAARSKLSGVQADLFSNMDAARQYARSSHEKSTHDRYTVELKDLEFKNWVYTEKMLLINGIVLFVCFSGMIYVLMLAWQAGTVSSGDMVLVLALMSQITGMMIFLGQALQSVARTYGEFQEGLKELIVPHEITDLPTATTLTPSTAHIQFTNLTFSYDSQTIFDTLTLDIKPGERVGLVGPSGAGKSTLVSLLLRQHDIDSGSITIDNQNIAEVTQDSLRSNIALVPQEPMLFHRTIAENIKYGKPDATYDEMVTAADRAQAREFIEALPEQYDTLVGERGVKLSGGQKQRVAIARAMLKEAPILVLDEATSALDSESEVAIQKALESLMENKTVIAVAHRLSTLRKMDRILVIDNGAIVEDGTHDTLAEAGGLYAKLWAHQAGGFLVE